MRPAVYASVVRNRHKSRGDRTHRAQPHGFSMRRLLAMVFVGAILLAPGLTLTILGLDDRKDKNERVAQSERILYKVMGPISCAVGGFILVAAIFYYCCYGLADQSRRHRHTSSSKSNTSHHGLTAYSSANSERPHENQNQSHDSKGRRHSSHSSMHRHNHHHHHHHHETEKKEAGFSQDRAQRLPETMEINMATETEDVTVSRWEQ
ncbi:uncharacterized protein LOC125670774 isoform X2 [Ostrea edulis]|uniref:uncharacterized protein LOC125670774 isoform X2 n=1 Tax=Ostrea edulis TaxID=37623 RepID=UPI002095A363|nr:uncharacterized protein LOC125670774 isoform X2 [Ostrea edulis]XP_056018187.1 uncharacterized protein LOC125670774 isoform X2 [Ostrea edulis]